VARLRNYHTSTALPPARNSAILKAPGIHATYSGALRGGLGLTELNTEWDQYEHISDLGIAAEAFARAFGRQPSTEQLSTTIEYLRHHT
jgi:hypothetical protein